MLIHLSQSKLSQEQLNQLQKDTHFDKKELQQWYKGWCCVARSLACTEESVRFFERLPKRNAQQRGVPEDIQAILSLRRPNIFRGLCFQRL